LIEAHISFNQSKGGAMEDMIVEFLLTGLYHCGYYSLFLMTFLEAAVFLGVFIPGETLVIMAGLAAAKGIFEIHEVVWVSALGAILGDTVGYFMGARFGERVFMRFGKYLFLKEGRLNDSRSFFENHGGKTIFLGRFMSLLRACGPYSCRNDQDAVPEVPVLQYQRRGSVGSVLCPHRVLYRE
jgi:membrane-associated protein